VVAAEKKLLVSLFRLLALPAGLVVAVQEETEPVRWLLTAPPIQEAAEAAEELLRLELAGLEALELLSLE
tara:strand:+ start:754 stop:963 length:210 start_codon:yes stop_codon:yes gene_type:complete